MIPDEEPDKSIRAVGDFLAWLDGRTYDAPERQLVAT
jgi:hypothetical protein